MQVVGHRQSVSMQRRAILTIDDSPSRTTGVLLDELRARGLAAIFFARGDYVERRQSTACEILRSGHLLANHAYSHRHFSQLSLPDCIAEISKGHAAIEGAYRACGRTWDLKCFRFPYGDNGGGSGYEDQPGTMEGRQKCAALQRCLRGLGYRGPADIPVNYRWYTERRLGERLHWFWTYDIMEWSIYQAEPMHGIDSMAAVLSRMDEHLPAGSREVWDQQSAEIIVLHDHPRTAEHLPAILDRLMTKGIDWIAPHDLVS